MHPPTPALFAPAPLRKRLWQAGTLLAMFIATLVAGNFLIGRDRSITSEMVGHDFLPFYVAGTFVRQDQFDLLYNLGAVRQAEQRIARENNLDIRDSFGPFWNPPFYALLFAPLAALPYETARNVWIIINLFALAGAIVLLCRMIPGERDWRNWVLVPLLVALSMPFLQALTHGQNTFTSLFLLCGVVSAWRLRRDLLAGMLCGLMFYKPQLAALIAIMLILTRGVRAGIGVGFVLGTLFLVTAYAMPGAIGDYLHQLPLNLHFMQIQNEYLWERHVTLLGLWRLMIQGRGPGETVMIVQALTWISSATIGGALLWLALRIRRPIVDDPFTGETGLLRQDRFIAACISAMPLIMPFYFDYDVLLLAVPMVLLGGEWMMRAPGRQLTWSDRLLVGSAATLYLWLLINPGVARMTGINVGTMLLAAVAAMLILRAGTPIPAGQYLLSRPQIIPVTARRAA